MTDIKQYEPLWGSWHVDAFLGEGSFGKVYKVRKEEFGQVYYSAVKIISIPQSETEIRQAHADGLDDASLRSYFYAQVSDILQEINLMNDLRGNSNVVSFEDHKVIEKQNEVGWDILIRMELLTSLYEHIAEKPLSPDGVAKLGIDICKALELCTRQKIIHRDIKPENIFVSKFGEYKLGDFGIARQIERTMSGLSKKGTYTYMAPEVFKGEEYGATVDMYSLGMVMYRLLNRNRMPFLPLYPEPMTPKNREAALQRRMKGEAIPLPVDGSDALKRVILKACTYDRKERFSSAAEMRSALEALEGGGKSASFSAESSHCPDFASPIQATTANIENVEHTGSTSGVFGSSAAWAENKNADYTSATEGVFTNSWTRDGKSAADGKDAAKQEPSPKSPSILLIAGIVALITIGVAGGFLLGNQAKNINSVEMKPLVVQTAEPTQLSTIAPILTATPTPKPTATSTPRPTATSKPTAAPTARPTATPISAQSVLLPTKSITLEMGEKYQISATVVPANAANKHVTFSTTSNYISVDSNGLITAKAYNNWQGYDVGSAEVHLTVGNATDTIYIKVVNSYHAKWSPSRRRVNGWNVTTLDFSNPVPKCTGFDISYTVKKGSASNRKWAVFAYDGKKWKRVGDFVTTDRDMEVKTTASFDTMDIERVAVVPSSKPGSKSTSWESLMSITTLRY